jgi:hypothetical protein
MQTSSLIKIKYTCVRCGAGFTAYAKRREYNRSTVSYDIACVGCGRVHSFIKGIALLLNQTKRGASNGSSISR